MGKNHTHEWQHKVLSDGGHMIECDGCEAYVSIFDGEVTVNAGDNQGILSNDDHFNKNYRHLEIKPR